MRSPAFASHTIVLSLIFLLSVVIFGLSSAYGYALAWAPVEGDVRNPRSAQVNITTLVLYSGTAPLLSAFAAFVSLILSLICDLTSALSLKITIVPIIAWILQTSIWLDCEYEGSTVSTTIHAHCPQAYLEHHGADVARELSGGKVTLAWVTIAVELLYLYACVYEVFQLQCTPDRQLSEGSSLGDESDMGKRLNA